MAQLGRLTALVLMLGSSLFICSAKADKANEEPAVSRAKASSIRPARDPKAPLPPSNTEPATDSTADIPLFPQEDQERTADLKDGVTAKANIATTAAAGTAVPGKSGSIVVSADSKLKKSTAATSPGLAEVVETGDAIEVAAASMPSGPSFRGSLAGQAASAAPQAKIPAPSGPGAVRSQSAGKTVQKQAATKPLDQTSPTTRPKSAAKPPKPEPPAAAGANSPAPAESLSRYFEDGEELVGAEVTAQTSEPADGSEKTSGPAAEEPVESALLIGSASSRGSAVGKPQTLAEALEAEGEVGKAVPKVNPWQSLVSLAAVLALILALAAVLTRLRRRNPAGVQRLNVIEEIGLGQGRQILIVEVMGDALVLGMTPQSINLLDKLPVDSFASDYRGSVDAILAREASQARRWSERPAFRSELRSALNVPRITTVPGRQLSLGDLRRSRQPVATVQSVEPMSERQGKADLIDRIREQLQRLEG